jgi:hypothetical protein
VGGGDVVEQRLDVESFDGEGRRARLESTEVEDALHELAEPLDLGQRRGRVLGIVGLDAVDDVLESGAQRGEGGAQLVGHVRDQRPALPIDLGQLGAHPVEGAGQLADLVAGGDGDRMGEVAVRHGP